MPKDGFQHGSADSSQPQQALEPGAEPPRSLLADPRLQPPAVKDDPERLHVIRAHCGLMDDEAHGLETLDEQAQHLPDTHL
eukprot:1926863-Lingulodinium_polyedra.AAC.1